MVGEVRFAMFDCCSSLHIICDRISRVQRAGMCVWSVQRCRCWFGAMRYLDEHGAYEMR